MLPDSSHERVKDESMKYFLYTAFVALENSASSIFPHILSRVKKVSIRYNRTLIINCLCLNFGSSSIGCTCTFKDLTLFNTYKLGIKTLKNLAFIPSFLFYFRELLLKHFFAMLFLSFLHLLISFKTPEI